MTKQLEAEVIVFDQGNTLIMDPFNLILDLKIDEFVSLFKKHNIPINPKELINAWKKSNERVNYKYCGHFSQEEPIIQDALKSLEIPSHISVLLGLELLHEYRIGLKEVIESDKRTEEVRRTLGKLSKNKRLGVFSDDRIVGLGMVLDFMGISNFFEYIETSESIGIEKPDIEVFKHMLNHFGIPPSSVVYVGDDPKRDVDGAKEAGLKVILYKVDPRKYNIPWRNYDAETKYKPDAVIEEFVELLNIIRIF